MMSRIYRLYTMKELVDRYEYKFIPYTGDMSLLDKDHGWQVVSRHLFVHLGTDYLDTAKIVPTIIVKEDLGF